MLVNVHHDSPAEHRRLLVSGVVFLTVIAMLIGLSIAIYQKVFDRVTTVTIYADRAGLQLAKFGDVRVNGALVGQVRDISQDGKQAVITVALEPHEAERIPDNSTVEIVPTTLFGQKFIALVRPEEPSGSMLEDGDEIASDRVDTNVELNRILSQLFPLLRSVQPADLNATLHALATALGGRGGQIGETLDDLDGYLTAIEDDLPTLREDLELLADVADTYNVAAPDLLGVLDNVTTTSRTIIDQREQLDTFFGDLSGLSDTSTRLLRDNEQDLIEVGRVTAPVMQLLATYSPEFPCLIKGANNYRPRLSATFRGGIIHQYFVFNTPQYREYDRRDEPVYGEVGRGPWCLGLPDPPIPIGPQPLDDGTNQDDNPPSSTAPGPPSRASSSGTAGTAADQAIVNAVLAARSGRAVDSYGSLGSLMYGPVVRGGGQT